MILALQLVRLISEEALEAAFLPVPSRTLSVLQRVSVQQACRSSAQSIIFEGSQH